MAANFRRVFTEITIACGLFVVSATAVLAEDVGTAATSAEPTLKSIQTCMRSNLPESTSRQTIEIRSYDRAGGERRLQAASWVKYDPDKRDKMLTKVSAPEDLAGAAYLATFDNGRESIFTYLPALDRVKRLNGAALSGRLWGTDFSHEDMRLLQEGFAAGQASLLEGGQLAGRDVHRIAIEPADPVPGGYSQVELRVDQQTCVVLEASFLGPDAQVQKRMSASVESLLEVDGRWSAREMVMRDLENGTHTQLNILQWDADVKIAGRAFNPRTFYEFRE